MKLVTFAAISTCFAFASPAVALDFGNGFSLTGSVELEYLSSSSLTETLSFTDVTLGWRSQGGGALGFGLDVNLRDDRFLSDGDSQSGISAALVLTTPFGELAVGRPLPVLSRMFEVPQIGGARYVELVLLEAGGIDGSFLREIGFVTDLSSTGVTFQGQSNGLGYGLGFHRFTEGGNSVDGYEAALSYQMGRTEVFLGMESLDIPGNPIDRLRLGARYAADRWSVGGHLSEFDGPGFDASVATLFGDYQITEAFTLGAQVLDFSVAGGGGQTFYGVTGEYGFGAGGFAQLGVVAAKGGSDELVTASIGYKF